MIIDSKEDWDKEINGSWMYNTEWHMASMSLSICIECRLPDWLYIAIDILNVLYTYRT